MNGMGRAQEGQEGHQAVNEERDATGVWRGVLLRVTLLNRGIHLSTLLFTLPPSKHNTQHNGPSRHL